VIPSWAGLDSLEHYSKNQNLTSLAQRPTSLLRPPTGHIHGERSQLVTRARPSWSGAAHGNPHASCTRLTQVKTRLSAIT
jgi:hypothetical protein